MSAASVGGAKATEVQAQAKVNLRLRILAREASGYHQLETLFLRLGLADTVRVRRSRLRWLDVIGLPDGATLGPAEENLAWRAAEAYAAASRWRGGFAIEVEKRIPVGGGLGGGSADAGAVLRAMDVMSKAPLGGAALMRIAATLGADVPFLASEHAYVLAWGRGERMLALAAPESRPVVLVVPSFAVNTAAAYGWLAESADRRAPASSAAALQAGQLREWETIAALAVNDFEPVVDLRHPEIGGILQWLRELGSVPALMSGSGSVVFGVLPRGAPAVARGVRESVPFGSVIVTETASHVEPVRRLD